jgi:hypothetical protein
MTIGNILQEKVPGRVCTGFIGTILNSYFGMADGMTVSGIINMPGDFSQRLSAEVSRRKGKDNNQGRKYKTIGLFDKAVGKRAKKIPDGRTEESGSFQLPLPRGLSNSRFSFRQVSWLAASILPGPLPLPAISREWKYGPFVAAHSSGAATVFHRLPY